MEKFEIVAEFAIPFNLKYGIPEDMVQYAIRDVFDWLTKHGGPSHRVKFPKWIHSHLLDHSLFHFYDDNLAVQFRLTFPQAKRVVDGCVQEN